MNYNCNQDFKKLDDDVLMREFEGVKAKLDDLNHESNFGYIGHDHRKWLATHSNALQYHHAVTVELRRRGQQIY